MDPPTNGEEIKPENLEEAKEGGPSFHCDLSDSEVVYKIAQALLPGLASACVDRTTGDLLRTTESVAVDIRRDMVDYLVQRSESFVAESVVLEGAGDTDVPDKPYDIISNFIDDFAASKRNFLSRVSGWLLSDRREDRIDDFIQEMELDGFWLIGRRETVAQTLLKNVDFKNAFHCDMKFKAFEELNEHRVQCSFRTIICRHEGCDSRFSASHLEEHESACPFKIIPCEQKCPNSIMRREMDRHCITVCTMKLVNCPFYQFGCHLTVPQCKMHEHLLDNLQSHILHILRMSHKGFSEESLEKRLDDIEKISSSDNLASLRDARSLTNAVKNYERKLGPIEEIKVEAEPNVVDGESKEKKGSSSSSSSEENLESPRKNGETLKSSEPKESQEKNDSLVVSPVPIGGISSESPEEDPDKSAKETKILLNPPASEREVATKLPSREEYSDKSPTEKATHENSSPIQSQPELKESLDQGEKLLESVTVTQKQVDSPTEKHMISTSSSDKSTSPIKRVETVKSPTKMEKLSESSDNSKKHEKLPTKKYDQEDSPFKTNELKDSLVKINEQKIDQDKKLPESETETPKQVVSPTEKHRISTSSSEKSASPVKRVEMIESPTKMKNVSESSDGSEKHEESATKKYDQDSPFKRNELEDSLVKINEQKIDQDKKLPESETVTPKQVVSPTEKHRISTSSSDKSASPVERVEMIDSPTEMEMFSESSDDSEKHEESPTKKN